MATIIILSIFFTAPNDYTIETRTVTFNPGTMSQTVLVQTLADQIAEDTEQFIAVLSNPTAGAVLGDDTATVDIDDPTVVVVEFDPTSFSVQESFGVATFTVVKRTLTTREVTVLFSTQDGTATGKRNESKNTSCLNLLMFLS